MKPLVYFFCIMIVCSCGTNRDLLSPPVRIPGLQKLEVVTPAFDATKGTMYIYERKDTLSDWINIKTIEVNVGRNGLAWDENYVFKYASSEKIKHEGDGCSPAGVFTLGKIFSYYALNDLKMPFEQVDENDLCVDDTTSVYYNTLIDTDTVKQKDYKSFETMQRKDDQYAYGVWVNYNTGPVSPGNGSCIFLHIWKDPDTPTSGCTSMRKEDMLFLIDWLDAARQPVLIQYAKVN